MPPEPATQTPGSVWEHTVTESDEQLRCEIEDELSRDPLVNPSDITVTVAGDVITITGIVRSHPDRVALLGAVRRVSGTRAVKDLVATRHSNEGNAIRQSVTEAIRRSFHRAANIDAGNVGVECEGATVWLTGRVQSFAARTHAEYAAWGIPGVKVVNNDIRVGSAFLPRGSAAKIDDAD
jgi:osmotically-inducible protein OsmY